MCSDIYWIESYDREMKGLNPTLDWICAPTDKRAAGKLKVNAVLILLWTGYVL